MNYYRKELPDQPVYLSRKHPGMPFRFDWLETDDPLLIEDLDSFASQHIGGVIPITQAEYAEGVKKKKPSDLPPDLRRLPGNTLSAQNLRVSVRPSQGFGRHAPVAEADRRIKGPPLEVPDPAKFEFKPTIGKIPQLD